MAYQMTAPLRLKLSELPIEGKEFEYNSQEHVELRKALQEVFGENDFSIQIRILPTGEAFHMTGVINGKRDLLCSRCAADVKFVVHQPVDEFFTLFAKEPARIEQSSRVNHQSDLHGSGSDWTTLEGEDLDLAAYFREIVLANEPLKITQSPPCDDACPELLTALAQGWLKPLSEEAVSSNTSPFAKLKELKLN